MATFKVVFIKEIIYKIDVILRFLLYDFYYNNKDDYKMLKDEKYLNMMTNCTIWIYKLCKYYEFFFV